MGNTRRVSAGFYVLLFGIVVASFLIHEAGHWLAGTALGYEMTFALNSVVSTTPLSPRDAMIVSAAGPIVTAIQGVVSFVLIVRRDVVGAYAVLFVAAMLRVMATVVSVSNPNDEARISLQLGLGQWTLPILVSGALIVLVVIASRTLRLGWRTNVLTYLVCTVTLSAVVGLDWMLKG